MDKYGGQCLFRVHDASLEYPPLPGDNPGCKEEKDDNDNPEAGGEYDRGPLLDLDQYMRLSLRTGLQFRSETSSAVPRPQTGRDASSQGRP